MVDCGGGEGLIKLTENPVHAYGRVYEYASLKQITIRCVGRWADRYQCWPVGHPDQIREGELPRDARERDALLQEVYSSVRAWLDRDSLLAGYELVGVVLYSNDQVLLDMHDGNLGHLFLSDLQVQDLSTCWRDLALPPDLYVRATMP
jgi:hypothetical protein